MDTFLVFKQAQIGREYSIGDRVSFFIVNGSQM